MGLRLCSLSSGSRGNCIIIASDTTAVLVDAGVSVSFISRGLRLLGLKNPKVLLTHAHSDHIGHLPSVTKKLSPEAYCHFESYDAIKRHTGGARLIPVDGDFFVGDITVSPFKVSHDVACVGYSFYQGGRKLSVVTDLGCLTAGTLDALKGSNLVFIESNHDEELLMANASYPRALKKRILSARGHLSNAACAEGLKEVIKSGAGHIILGHLSEQNNYPELARSTVSRILNGYGIVEGVDYRLDVAGYKKLTDIFEIS